MEKDAYSEIKNVFINIYYLFMVIIIIIIISIQW